MRYWDQSDHGRAAKMLADLLSAGGYRPSGNSEASGSTVILLGDCGDRRLACRLDTARVLLPQRFGVTPHWTYGSGRCIVTVPSA